MKHLWKFRWKGTIFLRTFMNTTGFIGTMCYELAISLLHFASELDEIVLKLGEKVLTCYQINSKAS